jgi:hypothetical protein
MPPPLRKSNDFSSQQVAWTIEITHHERDSKNLQSWLRSQ